jgi:hypothetical protein
MISIRPRSAQRRNVSSLTPRRPAASLIRNIGIFVNLPQPLQALQTGRGQLMPFAADPPRKVQASLRLPDSRLREAARRPA